MMHTLWDLLWANHNVGNFTASVVIGGAGFIYGERRIVRKLHDLHRKHDELHDKVDAINREA